jgi:hypothetical protein
MVALMLLTRLGLRQLERHEQQHCDCEYFHVVFYITTVSLTFFGNFAPEKPDNNLKAFPNQHKS